MGDGDGMGVGEGGQTPSPQSYAIPLQHDGRGHEKVLPEKSKADTTEYFH